jgi:hypothetical protein
LAADITRWQLEARILAGQSYEEIASKCAVPRETVALYEAVFFDVSNCLDSWMYILFQVVGLYAEPGLEDVGTLLKFYGYRAGPLVLDEIIKVVTNPLPLPQTWVEIDPSQRDEFVSHLLWGLNIRTRLLPWNFRIAAKLARAAEVLESISAGADPTTMPGPAALFKGLAHKLFSKPITGLEHAIGPLSHDGPSGTSPVQAQAVEKFECAVKCSDRNDEAGKLERVPA